MSKLVLVDGSSYLYRAFHALPDLRTSRGEPTGAIRGVVAMLRRLFEDGNPEYFAVVFDAPGKTFRDDWYPQYKANRPPMPPDLALQIAPLHELIRAHGWPLLMIEGVEADDVIGTLVRRGEARDIDAVISTGDKDLAQLVTPRVTLVNTMSNEILDEQGVLAKFGVRPDQLLDLLTLTGDAVDNVPGVAKVGPKTAAKWLAQYGTLENVMAHAQEIGGVVGENLRAALDWLPQGRRLLTVKTDCALPFEPIELVPRPADTDALKNLYARFEFKSWLKDLDSAPAEPSEAVAQAEDAVATDQGTVAPAGGARLRDRTRSSGVRALARGDRSRGSRRLRHRRRQASIRCRRASSGSPSPSRRVGAAYIPLAHRYAGAPIQLALDAVLARLKPWFEDPKAKKLGQNVKYDQHVLANHGIALAGVAHDTMLQSYVLESHRAHDMDSLASRHLDVKTITYAGVTGKGASQIGFEQVAVDRATEYAAEDADVTLQLHGVLYPRLAADTELERVYQDIELPTREVLFRMERNGVLLDPRLACRTEQGTRHAGRGARAAGVSARRRPVQSWLAATARRNSVRADEAAGCEEDRDRPAVDRRRGAAGARRRLSAAEASARAPDAVEAQVDLHRQAAADDQCDHGSRAHQLRAGDRGDRTARKHRSESAEHSRAHRGGAAHPRGFHRAAGPPARFGRLFADRAAHHGASVRRSVAARGICRRRRHSPRDCGGDLRGADAIR